MQLLNIYNILQSLILVYIYIDNVCNINSFTDQCMYIDFSELNSFNRTYSLSLYLWASSTKTIHLYPVTITLKDKGNVSRLLAFSPGRMQSGMQLSEIVFRIL